MDSSNDSQWLSKRYVSRRAALRAGILGAAIPGILYVAKSAASADAADGDIYIPGAPNFLELGHGWPGKEANAGKISYRRWSDALDIVGAGTAAGYRKVKIWDDLYVQGLVNLRAYVVDPEVPPAWTAFLYARSINGQTKPFWKDTTGTAQPLVARSATMIVAASNASPRSKLGADFVCDGINDEQEINAAIAALPASGGTVQLSEGTFTCAAPSGNMISISGNNITLAGMGMDATLIDVASHGTWSADIGAIGTRVVLKDFTINGAGASASAVEMNIAIVGTDDMVLRVRSTDCGGVSPSANFRIESAVRPKLIDCVSDNARCSGGNDGGVYVYRAQDVYIKGLYSHSNAKNGLVLFPDEDDVITVVDYLSEDEGRSGIFFIPSPNCHRLAKYIQIENPVIKRAGGMGIDGSPIGTDIDLSCLVIRGGVVERCSSNGIDMGPYSGGYTCIGVTALMNNYKHTDLSEGSGWGGCLKRVRLIGCKAISNGSAGISLWTCSDALIDGCLIANNGLWNQNQGVFVFDDDVTGSFYNTVRNCLFDDWQATAAKNLVHAAAAGQKVVEVSAADGAAFFPGQKVSIDDTGGAAELNVIDTVTWAGDGHAVLTMVNNLARQYTTANSATVTGVATQLIGIQEPEGDLSDYNVYEGNDLRSSAITTKIKITGANSKARNNLGYATENSGTATLASGTTSVTVSHGLDVTPSAGNIIVIPVEDWGSMTKFWVGDYSSTQFTIYADRNPGRNVEFAWKAAVL